MTGWMKQTRRQAMANETKVYVGKTGAKTLYKRLKDLIGRITTYQKVTNTTESGVPIVVNPNSRTIYLVKDNTVVGDDKYKEWIWTSDLGWECIGTTSIPENAWKQWAEDNGSVGTTDTVYLGKNNNLARTWSFGFGNNNTSSSTLDNVDWSGSDVVMIGSFNSAIDAAGAYQVGFRNSVVNNHRMSEASPDYNYYTAINFGNGNEIDAEGMNLGKDNTAADFGMNIGQHNTANHASLSIGERVSTNQASISIGTDSIAENKSLSIGFGSVAAGVLYNNGEFLHSGEYGSSVAIGINHLCAAKNSIAIGSGVTTADTYSIVSGGSFAILAEGIQLAQQASNINGNSFGVGSCLTLTSSSFSIGRFNTADNYSYAIGERNTVNCGSFAIGQNNTLIGDPNGESYAYGYAFATGRDLNDVRGRSCTFGIGNNHITQFAYAAGLGNNSIHESAVAVGIENTDVYYHSTAVGAHNNNIHGDGVAIGNGNRDIRDMGTAVGSYNYEVYGGSFAAGEANAAQNGSIAIGISNKARCGGFLFGIGNYAIAYPTDSYYISYHANSVVMGFGNEVYNVREGLHKSGWTKFITTCGIAMGAYIKAYGHNFISFGSSNTLGDVDNWMNDTATNTDNDGFMTAIGFQCTAKRNYDFAYGYQSVANGGENIAFQHSTAIGYRNVAIVDSTISNSVANFALCESTLNSTASRDTVLHNFLFNSKQTWSDTSSSNVFLSTNGSFSGTGGLHRNIVSIGTNGNRLNIACGDYGSCTDNIMIGTRNGEVINSFNAYSPISITLNRHSMARNMLINNAYGTININYDFVDNKITNSELNVTATRFTSNIMHDSVLRCTNSSTSMVHNVLLSLSDMDLRQDCTEAYHNFLFLSHLGDSAAGSSLPRYSSAGSNNNMSQNFLVGTTAYHTQGCVSFSVPSSYDGPFRSLNTYTDGKESAFLNDCGRVVNFGDNKIQYASLGFVYGAGNKLSFTNQSVVFGNQNEIAQISGTSTGTKIGDVHIFGAYNNVKFNNESGNLFTFGAHNNHTAGIYSTSNFIYGDYNSIGEYVSAESRKMTPAQINNIQTPSPGTIFIPTEQCISASNETMTWVWQNYAYYVYGNLITNAYAEDYAGTTITSISGQALLTGVYNGTLPNGYYKATSDYNLSPGPHKGMIVRPGKAYCKYKDGTRYSTYLMQGGVGSVYNRATSEAVVAGCYTDQPASYTSMNMIFGRNNAINSRVVGYSVMGQVNRVTYTGTAPTTDFAISNGFVQGNSNVALNGSNIICMGNGNQSTGHNSVAIGSQLISNQWQTVLGKYNAAIAGPNRLASETPQDPTKALLIVGNGYSTKDDSSWQDESFITRSNALELYADGRLKISGKIEASNIPPAPVADGQYALACEVVSGVATYRWVAVGSN